MRLADIVKNYRRQKGLTQDELGKLAKCSKAYISMIENDKDSKTGRSVNPSITLLHNLANAMNMSTERFYRLLDKDISIHLNPTSINTNKYINGYEKTDKRLPDITMDKIIEEMEYIRFESGEDYSPTKEQRKMLLELMKVVLNMGRK